MNQKEYTDRFNKLYNLISEVYLSFYVWKGLEDKLFKKIYSENNHFWFIVLLSLENNWLAGLAKIYEKSNYSKTARIISVFALLPYQADSARATKVKNILESNTGIIENIQKLRHNQLAHNNAQHLLNPKKILRKYPIKYAEVEKLLQLSGKILSNLNPVDKHGYLFDNLANNSKNDSKDIMKKLQYCSKLRKEHFDKLRRGELKIEEYRFPPV